MMLKPPISRMGGKSKLRKTIISMLPVHICYVELFFGEKEHLLLRDKLCNIKGKFILTINDHEKVREWYKGFNIKEVEVNYSV
jgi:site-specific DNA-adenine methylase